MADVFDQASATQAAPIPSPPAASGDMFDHAASGQLPPAQPMQSPDSGLVLPQNQGAAQGLKEGAGDVWDTIKATVSHPLNAAGGLIGAGAQTYDSIKEMVPVLHAYENARASGKGVIDSLSAANDQAKQQDQAVQMLKERAEEFKKSPTAAGMRAIVDAGAAALAMWAGDRALGKIGAPEVAAPEVEASAENPGIVQQVLKGKDVAQPQAKAALQATGEATPSLRDTLDTRIKDTFKKASDAYSAVDDAAGTDIKGLSNKLNKAVRQSRMAATPEAADAWEEKINDLAATIDESKQRAIQAGVDPATLKDADASFRQAKALEEVNQRVFKNVNVVKGNTAAGTPETIDVDKAVDALQALQNKEKFGGPRLEDAFGKDGAKELLDNFYEAQRNGVHALKVQQVAKWVGGLIAGGTILRGLESIQ